MKAVTTTDVYRQFLGVAARNELSVDSLLDAADVCLLSAAEILDKQDDMESQMYATELIAGAYISLAETRLAYRKSTVNKQKLQVIKGDKK